MRLLCKKNFKAFDKVDTITQGDVVYLKPHMFGYISEKPYLSDIIEIDIQSLRKHFMIYDELEYEDAYTAIETLLLMSCRDSELDLLEKIENYIKSRRKYLCEMEAIRQEQEKTETLHTTSQM